MAQRWFTFIALVILFMWFQPNASLLFERKRPLPIPGTWSAWGSWSPCEVNGKNNALFYPEWEDFAVQIRNRSCTDPAPLFGGDECVGPSHRFKQCLCNNPLGMGNGRVGNTQLSASSESSPYLASEGRLGGNFTGWCSEKELSIFSDSYFQVDFTHFVHVSALSTAGASMGRVRRYRLDYSLDGRSWKAIYQDSEERVDLFSANILPGSVVRIDFPQHILMKHLRIKPANSFGKTCMKVEMYGCTFSCGNFLSSADGFIFGQSSEIADQNCLWKIHVLNTTSLTFNFQSFFILCQYGYLDFHDGTLPFGESPVLKRLCLQTNHDEVDVYKHFGSSVWVNFVSNSSSLDMSFYLNYFSSCRQEIQLLSGVPVTISSPNYPERYFDNTECLWDVALPKGLSISEIEINLEKFGIEGSSRNSCSSDYLSIITVMNGSSVQVGSYCNTNLPPRQFHLWATALKVVFKSDSYISDIGFKLIVTAGYPLTSVRPDRGPPHSTSTSFFQSTSNYTQEIDQNNSYPQMQRKLSNTNDSDDTWTIVTVSAFSAIVFVLLVSVAAMNIRRFVLGRSEVNAQCAKMAAEEKLKKKKKLAAANSNIRREQLDLLLKRASESPISGNAPALSGLADSRSCTPLISASAVGMGMKEIPAGPARSPSVTYDDDCVIRTCDKDTLNDEQELCNGALPNQNLSLGENLNVDDGSSYDSCSPQVHSAMKDCPEPTSGFVDATSYATCNVPYTLVLSDFDSIGDTSESVV